MDKDFSRKRNMFCIFLYSSLKNRKKGHNNKVNQKFYFIYSYNYVELIMLNYFSRRNIVMMTISMIILLVSYFSLVLGRRTQKIDSSKSTTNPETTIYVYSGDNILSEYKTIWTGTLILKKNYINGIGTDSVIAYEAEEQISSTSTGKVTSRYYYHKKPILFKYGFLWVLYWAIILVLFILLEHQVFSLILSHTYQLIHLYFLQ